MFFFRMLSFIVGLATMLTLPFLLLPEAEYRPFAGPNTVLLVCAAIAGLTPAYFYFGAAMHRMARSALRRTVAAVLMALQFALAGWLVNSYPEPYMIALFGVPLCFSVFLFCAFAWPGARSRSYRPLRRREESDQTMASKRRTG